MAAPATDAQAQRRLHLGVDFGTSQSKLVFRDYGRRGGDMLGDYAVVVRPTREDVGAPDFRIPSSLSFVDGTLHFGFEAEQRAAVPAVTMYRSLKMLLAIPEHFHGVRTALPLGLQVEDMAALYVGYLLQLGARSIQRYLPKGEPRARLTITLGVPMSELDNAHLKELFLRLARTAVEVFRAARVDLRAGLPLAHATDLINTAKRSVPPIQDLEPADWVRAEAPSALLWAFRSPRVAAGLYAVVDIGAGTTSSSWFLIEGNYYDGKWVKNRMAFYGASCNPPGADALEEAVARQLGTTDPAALRGQVNEALGRLGEVAADIRTIREQIFKTYQTAFGRSYPKYRQQSYWHGVRLFLIGGGTLINVLRDRLCTRAWLQLNQDPPIVDAGHPDDLHEEGGEPYAGDPRFLLVAYGLSHFAADVPEILNPNDIPPFRPAALPERKLGHHEDLYLGK